MSYTTEQLSAMSNTEINSCVAVKLGFTVQTIWKEDGIIILKYLANNNEVIRPVNYCQTPNDFMPIALECRIDIDHDIGKVYCCWGLCSPAEKTRFFDRKDVGRAVCEAFLLMRGKGSYAQIENIGAIRAVSFSC